MKYEIKRRGGLKTLSPGTLWLVRSFCLNFKFYFLEGDLKKKVLVLRTGNTQCVVGAESYTETGGTSF